MVALADGRDIFLAADAPQFDRWMVRVRSELTRHHPVGIQSDGSGRVTDLNYAHDTSVQEVYDSSTTPDCVRVGFWAYAPLCGLSREHPEFERVYATLTEAVESRRAVYVAVHTCERIADDFGDGDAAELPKIMDARPVEALPEPATPLPPAACSG